MPQEPYTAWNAISGWVTSTRDLPSRHWRVRAEDVAEAHGEARAELRPPPGIRLGAPITHFARRRGLIRKLTRTKVPADTGLARRCRKCCFQAPRKRAPFHQGNSGGVENNRGPVARGRGGLCAGGSECWRPPAGTQRGPRHPTSISSSAVLLSTPTRAENEACDLTAQLASANRPRRSREPFDRAARRAGIPEMRRGAAEPRRDFAGPWPTSTRSRSARQACGSPRARRDRHPKQHSISVPVARGRREGPRGSGALPLTRQDATAAEHADSVQARPGLVRIVRETRPRDSPVRDAHEFPQGEPAACVINMFFGGTRRGTAVFPQHAAVA